ncbi:hypothetical protein Trydic_g1190 [Trypoxylus dichotomus]
MKQFLQTIELLIDVRYIIEELKIHTDCIRWNITVLGLSTCEIISDKLIAPHDFEGNLNVTKDYQDNELPQLLEEVSLEVRRKMQFQHDGCPVHYSVNTFPCLR